MTLPGFNPYVPRPIDRPTEVPLDPAADLSVLDEAKILVPPADPGQWPAWRAQLARWRAGTSVRVAYDGSRYDRIDRGCHTVCLAWLWDEALYDHARGTFTVDAFLDAAQRDVGGFDGVVLWHAYPVIGLDDRDQFDLYGEVTDLPDAVAAFRRRGVKVFVSYYPWEPGDPDRAVGELVKTVAWLDADGVFLDTLKEGAAQLRAALDDVRTGLLLEGESKVPLARVHDHEAEAAVAPVYDVRDVLADPQYAALGTAVTVPDEELGAVRMQNVPFRMSATPGAIRHAGRRHGQDTEAVLREHGLSAEEVTALRAGGVL
jgi:hypothetical protein